MADKLEDPEVAYAYAGFDYDFTLFKMYTADLTNHATGEVGRFEVDYKGLLSALETDADPVGWLRRAVNKMVVKCCSSTNTEPSVWTVEFSPVLEKFNIPSHLFLNRQADRNWLGVR